MASQFPFTLHIVLEVFGRPISLADAAKKRTSSFFQDHRKCLFAEQHSRLRKALCYERNSQVVKVGRGRVVNGKGKQQNKKRDAD